jgi:NAD-dependent dihydropyrimidine dehydrogenase PreA subunit
VSEQRVLLLGRRGLFAQGVQEILEREGQMEVLVLHAMPVDTVARIASFSPDVVVIADESATYTALVAHVLRVYPDLPVVRVGLEESVVRVYRSEQVTATSASLLNTIRDLSAQPSNGNHLHFAPRTNGSPMEDWALPEINLLLCNRCGDCIEQCPPGAMEMGSDGPFIAQPADCIYCALCDAVCPQGAIIYTCEIIPWDGDLNIECDQMQSCCFCGSIK